MTQMALPIAYPSARRAEVAPAPRIRWRLLGAEAATALAVNLGPVTPHPAHRAADRGVMVAAAPGAVVAGPGTRLVAVQPSITSW
ncbi:hypothetical protein [Actinoplanes utahensis]|uniref:Uncharacterized protein n=1 Tax=Actinoplanes utahensis TaxID=1869 RepID=A0A0A6USJ2_ACTUT|nr:hypothetical protein [Actinoplanes utahensis]KHD77424.1 hypothetical protein MB27_11890 [Actinoplanes utahensis]GIF32799.1 hypothetical protein Aut01nite_57850 [Actinoplanes utahensis]